MKTAFIIIISIHALIHLLGFAKAFHLAEVPQLKQPISELMGVLWLVAFLLIVGSLSFFLLHYKWWWVAGLAAVLLSQGLILQSWREAGYGTIANVILLLPVIVATANALPSSYINTYHAEVNKGFARLRDMPLLTETDIAHLPAPVQKYLRYTGSVGKPRIQNFRAVFDGGIRNEMSASFMKLHVQQCNFFDVPTRVFYMEAKMWGIPAWGLHLYKDGLATMQVKAAGFFKVVDGKGEKMTQSETVTMFNDMCMMAPGTLVSENISWETVDPLTVKARYTNAGHTITAMLFFNETGQLINFSSDDRYLSRDGKTYTSYRWTTPVEEYKEFRGRRVAAYATAIWHTPEGEFCYGKFRTVDIEYNCKQLVD